MKKIFTQFFVFILVIIITSFTNVFAQPTITSFTPTSGPVGTLVTITGKNLSKPTAITIGTVSAIAISNTGTSLVAMVMPGAATGPVSVTTASGTANGTGNFTVTASQAPNVQQGSKLVGTGATGAASQGWSVSLSANGNTAIVGGYTDNSGIGAAWVYTRSSGGVWTQQGSKLVGTGATGKANQGFSVSISADGNTAMVGGLYDNSSAGAAWVYIRSGSGSSIKWSQQGKKLVGTGATKDALQGFSVSLSADGNTAFVGGRYDNSGVGAAWVYTRSGGVWSQQGSKLVGTNAIGYAQQGYSVSLSADGNTAMVGGLSDNSDAGAAWVYTRSGGVWNQQSNKLVGTGATGAANQGNSVSLSADGNTAMVCGWVDNGGTGAAWVYTRSGGVWSQQGSKLVGTGATGYAQQGVSVSLSADGNTAIVGGNTNNGGAGAAWVYTRSGGAWTQQGTKLIGSGAIGAAQQGSSVSLSADGNTAMVGGWLDNGGAGASWVYIYGQPTTITSFTPTSGPVGTLVTITGKNLSKPTAVTIGAVSAIAISSTDTSLVAMVMPGAAKGSVSVTTTAGGTANGTGYFTVTASQAPNAQQGPKLVGTGAIGAASQGRSISVSADGNTAIVGGHTDNSGIGAAWVYTRKSGVWTQQGSKLVGTGATGKAGQGISVSLSADGNTAMVGGYTDNSNVGATWVYTRSGGAWSQQGSKLVGTGATGKAGQGISVSLSADGNTAMVGGYTDNSNVGATWVYTRSGSGSSIKWSQQGSKLVGTGATGKAGQGISVSLSADGNTAMVGGYTDNSNVGATWVYTRSGSGSSIKWSQQGSKLVGMGATGKAGQGISVSLSADGNTAMMGGYTDNSNVGATWVYTRSGGAWSQQGSKLVGTGATGNASQGNSVSLSADGNTAIVGGYLDNGQVGATWVYTRSGGVWSQLGSKLVGTGASGAAQQGSSVSLSADGNTAMVGGLLDNGGAGASWAFTYVQPTTITSFTPTSGPVGTLVTITGTYLSTPTSLTIGAVSAIAISNTDTILVAMVMPGAATGLVSVTTAYGTAIGTGYFTVTASQAPNAQQGAKLVGTGATGTAGQGRSVSVSADGNTAIVGGPLDNSSAGAVWVYTRSASVWTQQGNKLVGTGATDNASQGNSVSLSADGNTAIVGGYLDNGQVGAAWVYTRSGGVWSQQGSKLLGSGASGAAQQGSSVSLSADGNTAIVGGANDNSGVGAAWVYTRSGGVWSQQGSKLVGTGASDAASQGFSVSLSADGNTAIVGGKNDNSFAGAAWVYTRSGGVWSQQGSKLVGTGATGIAQQGSSVSLSADGNTAMVGGVNDNSGVGASWVYTRSGGVWSQQGSKLVGTGATGNAIQGASISLSADGNTAMVGGPLDNNGAGAAWRYTRSGGVWTQQGTKLVGTGATGDAYQGISLSLSADGNTSIVGGNQDNIGVGAAWAFTYMPTTTITSATYNSTTGVLVVTGTNFVAKGGATNEVDLSKLSLTGEGGSSYTLTTSPNVEITDATSFRVKLNATDIAAVNQILNKNGTSSIRRFGTKY